MPGGGRALLAAACFLWQAALAQEPLFHCDVARNNANAAWSKKKKEWCCEHMDIACEAEFNCKVALGNYLRAWSHKKKEYCCRKIGVGCEGLPTTPPPSTTEPPQIDPGNLLAVAPLLDWPEAEGEGVQEDEPDEERIMPCDDIARHGVMRASVRRQEGRGCWEICREDSMRHFLAPWLALGLLVILTSVAFSQAISRAWSSKDGWAAGLEFANRFFLQVPLCTAAFLWLVLAGPEILILDTTRSEVCFKALTASLVGLPSLERFGVPPAVIEFEVYFSCVLGLLFGVIRFFIAEGVGRGGCGCLCCCCCCCRRRQPQPEDYEYRRPLKGCRGPRDECFGVGLFGTKVAAKSEGAGMISRISFSLQMGSILGVAMAIDLACLGQPMLTLCAMCGLFACARESATALRLNRAEWGGRIREVQCPWGSDTAALLYLSGTPEMGYPCNELLEKYGIHGATESVVFFYISMMVMVAAELPDHADIVLAMVTGLVSFNAIWRGVGQASEVASAERFRMVTNKGLPRAVQFSTVQDHCPKCGNAYMSDANYCRKCGLKRAGEHHDTDADEAEYRASLIKFQDYSGRKALAKKRLRPVAAFRACEVLPLAAGLALWCLGGMLTSGYTVGTMLASTWQVLNPRARRSGSWLSNVASSLLEVLLWPAFSTFAPLRLADPTRDHSERQQANVDHLVFPAWCGVRGLYILILWSMVLFNPDCIPFLPELTSVHDLKEPKQLQRLLAWILVGPSVLAAVLFPFLAVIMHSKRQTWAAEDWEHLARHEVNTWETATDILNIPDMYPEWSREEERDDYTLAHLDEKPLDKLAALDLPGFWSDLRSGRVYEESGGSGLFHMLQNLRAVKPPSSARNRDRQLQLGGKDPRYQPISTDDRQPGIGSLRPPLDSRSLPRDSRGSSSKEVKTRRLPHLVREEVLEDAERKLQVPIYDLFADRLDVYFAQYLGGMHVKYLHVRCDPDFGVVVSTFASQDGAVGAEGELKHQVMVQRMLGQDGVLRIQAHGGGGTEFGVLQPTVRGDFILKHSGLPVAVYEVGQTTDRLFSVFPVLEGNHHRLEIERKRPLAEAGIGLFGLGSDYWNFRSLAGQDAVLHISCMLAIVLLQNEADLGHFH